MRNGTAAEEKSANRTPLVLRIPIEKRKPLTYRITIRDGHTFSDNGPVPNLFKRLVLSLVFGWTIEVYRPAPDAQKLTQKDLDRVAQEIMK